jgi:hypothetical protein
VSGAITQALRQLAEAREGLLAVGDDIWAGISPRDATARREGFAFFESYSDKVATLDALAADITEMLERYVSNHTLEPRPDTPTDPTSAFHLDTDFTFKRPRGFKLRDGQLRKATTWRQMYYMVCQELSRAEPKKFAALAENSAFISKQGRKVFSRDPKDLRWAIDVGQGIYAEGNYSANTLCATMRSLLIHFGRDSMEMKIYLQPEVEAITADDDMFA